jgi:hypothetical protein
MPTFSRPSVASLGFSAAGNRARLAAAACSHVLGRRACNPLTAQRKARANRMICTGHLEWTPALFDSLRGTASWEVLPESSTGTIADPDHLHFSGNPAKFS